MMIKDNQLNKNLDISLEKNNINSNKSKLTETEYVILITIFMLIMIPILMFIKQKYFGIKLTPALIPRFFESLSFFKYL